MTGLNPELNIGQFNHAGSFRDEKARELKEFLEKHHSLMDSLSDGIKQLRRGQ
ncbi:hypothetical protein BSSX_p0093 (plasmid) [Bacillus subtilis]|nr:hypothetical protein BSSX_p0093 [Bacillus subtilis]